MLDPETTLDTVGKASEAATKFQEIILKVLGPHWTKKQADAEAYADERKLQTIRDNPDMEIAYTQDGMIARARTPEALAYRAEQRMLNDAIRQEANIENVLEATAAEIKQVTDSNGDSVNDDWITRFFNTAKDINSAEMQKVWGKILAGEVAKPGMFSMRTLETIRNLSQEEATIFQKVVPLVMSFGGKCFIAADEKLLREYDVYYADLVLLQECGLINLGLSNNPKVSNTEYSFLFSNTLFMQFWGYSSEETKFSHDVHVLTSAGTELCNILSYTGNKTYAIKWAENIFNRNRNAVKINLYDVQSVSDTAVNHSIEPFKILQK